MGPLVSIVTPFHNGVEDLAECIESVLAQTYDNFEYVLLNNASTDGAGEVAEHYASIDERIRYTKNDELLDQVPNYNRALTLIDAGSVYCKMVQADDWIFPRCIEEMVAVAETAPTVGIVSAYSSVGTNVILTGLDIDETVIDGRETCRRYFLDGTWLFGSQTSLMYRADLVRARNPFYRLDRPNEDTDVCFELLQECDFAFVHQVLTYLRPRQGSISAKTAQLRAWELADILYVERYAAACMTPAEFGKFRTWAWSRYYRQVAGRVLRSPFQPLPEGFWEFHRDGLTSVGRTLSMARVARGMVEVLARSVISPTRSIRSLSGRPVARPIR